MTRAGRAFLGATLGAVLTLLIHPASRPYIFSAFITPSRTEDPTPKGLPHDPIAISDWMAAAGDRFAEGKPLNQLELSNAIAAAREGVRIEPDNAYWRQMLACFYHHAGNEDEARRQWVNASACVTWNDYQSSELMQERDRLARDFGAKQSWQLAYVYYLRNANSVHMIYSYAHSLMVATPLSTDEGLLLRAAIIRNGALLREGARSIRIGDFGAEMSEEACHPPSIIRMASHHKLFLAQLDIHNRLLNIRHPDLADQVNKIYREMDAWYAFENAEEATDTMQDDSLLALTYAVLPSAFLVLAVVGAAIWFIGRGLRNLEHIHPAPAIIGGAVLAVGVYAITFLPLAAISTFLCCVFLTLGPKRERKLKIDDLGPMFSFTVGTLALVFMGLLGAFVLGSSAPAVALLSQLNVPREYFSGSGVLLGLAIIVLALLLLLAPLFAMALRVGTSFVLSLGLRKFGTFLAYASLALIVVGTPLCIYLDRANSDTVERLVTNEPVYYLSLPR